MATAEGSYTEAVARPFLCRWTSLPASSASTVVCFGHHSGDEQEIQRRLMQSS